MNGLFVISTAMFIAATVFLKAGLSQERSANWFSRNYLRGTAVIVKEGLPGKWCLVKIMELGNVAGPCRCKLPEGGREYHAGEKMDVFYIASVPHVLQTRAKHSIEAYSADFPGSIGGITRKNRREAKALQIVGFAMIFLSSLFLGMAAAELFKRLRGLI